MLRDVAKLKKSKHPNNILKWVGGSRAILDWKLENHNFFFIFDDYWFPQKMERGVGGWCELYPNVIWKFGIFATFLNPGISDKSAILKWKNNSVEKKKIANVHVLVIYLLYIYTCVYLTNMGISLGSLYLYYFIGLVNDVTSERFLINSILYCFFMSNTDIITQFTTDAQFHYNARFNARLPIL